LAAQTHVLAAVVPTPPAAYRFWAPTGGNNYPENGYRDVTHEPSAKPVCLEE
jgi:hypothetical protein